MVRNMKRSLQWMMKSQTTRTLIKFGRLTSSVLKMVLVSSISRQLTAKMTLRLVRRIRFQLVTRLMITATISQSGQRSFMRLVSATRMRMVSKFGQQISLLQNASKRRALSGRLSILSTNIHSIHAASSASCTAQFLAGSSI